MSIASDVTRIERAKAAIKAAIEGKGVTVPDATLLDGMAALIESIEAGGIDGVTVDEFIAARMYEADSDALEYIESIVDSTAFVNLFVDKGTATGVGMSAGLNDLTACVYFPSFISDKWKASRLRKDNPGSNAGTSIPSVSAGQTLYRLTFHKGGS